MSNRLLLAEDVEKKRRKFLPANAQRQNRSTRSHYVFSGHEAKHDSTRSSSAYQRYSDDARRSDASQGQGQGYGSLKSGRSTAQEMGGTMDATEMKSLSQMHSRRSRQKSPPPRTRDYATPSSATTTTTTSFSTAQPTPVSSSSPSSSYAQPPKAFILHQVEDHHTLNGIALQYRCSPDELKRVNNIWGEPELHARKVIKIPTLRHGHLYAAVLESNLADVDGTENVTTYTTKRPILPSQLSSNNSAAMRGGKSEHGHSSRGNALNAGEGSLQQSGEHGSTSGGSRITHDGHKKYAKFYSSQQRREGGDYDDDDVDDDDTYEDREGDEKRPILEAFVVETIEDQERPRPDSSAAVGDGDDNAGAILAKFDATMQEVIKQQNSAKADGSGANGDGSVQANGYGSIVGGINIENGAAQVYRQKSVWANWYPQHWTQALAALLVVAIVLPIAAYKFYDD